MIAIDTSVLVPALISWHEAHAVADAVLRRKPRIPAHVLLETYSVLTRLPAPYRASPAIVAEMLASGSFGEPLGLPAREYARVIRAAKDHGLTGGAIYDALIGATAKHAGASLVTRDRRAVAAYDAVGVEYDLVA